MRFAIAIGLEQGAFVGYVTDVSDLRRRLTGEMTQTAQVVADVVAWAERAKPGEWLDAPNFWVFCISGAPTKLRYSEPVNEQNPDLSKTRILH